MKTKQLKAALTTTVVGVLAPLAMAMPASAATVTWTGANGTSMNSGLNWGGTAPVNGDTVVFSSSANNQQADNDIASLSLAKIVFSGAVTGTSSKSFNVDGNDLTLTSGIDAIMTGSGGDHALLLGVTLGADATFKTTGSNTLSVGNEGAVLDLGTNDLTLQPDGGSITILGEMIGSGNIIKTGTGNANIMAVPGTGGFDGAVTVSDGVLSVSDNLGVNVALSGGTLKGTGTVGNVSMSSGSVAPGNSPGVINTGNLTYTGGSFDVELGGTADGSFDQTNVTGTVDLGSATELNVSLFGGFEPEVDDSFVVINNDGSDAVDGTFNGLADGDSFTLGDYTYQINYNGGSGNDVVLLVTATPSAPDTGIGSLLRSPLATLFAAVAVLGAIAYIRKSELKKTNK